LRSKRLRPLILGGTSESSALAAALAVRGDIEAILSLAGRTQQPAPAALPVRSGGFGGMAGLRAYCEAERIDAIIDATHPFAAQMSRHAAEACRTARIPLLAFTRAAWARRDGGHVRVDATLKRFRGDRDSVRRKAVEAAMRGLLQR